MRKYIRNIIRHKAKKEKVKPSKYVKYIFNEIQIRKYGSECRSKNQAKGTHPKHLWNYRIAMATSQGE